MWDDTIKRHARIGGHFPHGSSSILPPLSITILVCRLHPSFPRSCWRNWVLNRSDSLRSWPNLAQHRPKLSHIWSAREAVASPPHGIVATHGITPTHAHSIGGGAEGGHGIVATHGIAAINGNGADHGTAAAHGVVATPSDFGPMFTDPLILRARRLPSSAPTTCTPPAVHKSALPYAPLPWSSLLQAEVA